MEGVVKLGPWGGEGGRPWNTEQGIRLTRIRIGHGVAIDSLQFQYESDGELHWNERFGGKGGSHSEIILVDGEYLTCILGHFGKIGNYVLVRSLTFLSNIHKHGPYGKETGNFFCLPQSQNNMIEGFHGRAGLHLDSIGVYWRPIPPETGDSSTEVENTEESDMKSGSWLQSLFSCLGICCEKLARGTCTISLLGLLNLEWKAGSNSED